MTRLAALALLNLLLLAALFRPTPGFVRVHPLAPPLTRIAALGDHPLDARVTPPPPAAELLRVLQPTFRQSTTPEQRALLGRAGPIQGSIEGALGRASALRVAVERDADALARAVGPDRLSAFIAQRERLSASVGETRVWAELGAIHP